MSPLTALSSLWRQWKPRVDPRVGVKALSTSLQAGEALGDALVKAAPSLAQAAVADAAMRFEGGALALFIVEVRDSLRAQLRETSEQVHDAGLTGALAALSHALNGDTFVQHLVNTVLQATNLYTETQVLARYDEGRVEAAVEQLLRRSLCLVLNRSDAARRISERARRLEFIPLPQPSAPR